MKDKILIPENTTRTIDTLGRITIPKGLRNRMMLEDGDNLDLYTAYIDGIHCICMAKPLNKEDEIDYAIEILNKYGIEVNANVSSNRTE